METNIMRLIQPNYANYPHLNVTSSWERTIALALSLIAAGMSLEKASQMTNVPEQVIQQNLDQQQSSQLQPQQQPQQQLPEPPPAQIIREIPDSPLDFERMLKDLRGFEGLELRAYRDKEYWSIGYGHRASGPNDVITRDQAERYLIEDASNAVRSARGLLGEGARNGEILSIVSQMIYQMGTRGVSGFNDMLAAIGRGDLSAAADEMLNSDWFREDTPERAQILAERMRKLNQ